MAGDGGAGQRNWGSAGCLLPGQGAEAGDLIALESARPRVLVEIDPRAGDKPPYVPFWQGTARPQKPAGSAGGRNGRLYKKSPRTAENVDLR
jgi:hypothetical protein